MDARLPIATLLVAGLLVGCDSSTSSEAPDNPPTVAWDSTWALWRRTAHDSASLEIPAARFSWFESTYPTSIRADDARWWLGYVRYLQGRWSEARMILLSLPVAYPASVRIDNALHYAARCMVEETRYAAARDSIRHFLSDPRFASSTYRADSWYWLGRALAGLDSNASARAAYQTVLDSVPSDTIRDADAAYQIGKTWYTDSAWTTAQSWFDRVINAYPTAVFRHDNALYWRSRCQHRRNLEDSAIAGYRDLLARFPGSGFADQAGYQIGAAFHDRAYRTGPVAMYDSAIAAEDGFLATWSRSGYRDDAIYEKGKCHYRKGETATAETLLDSVIAMTPWSNLRDYALYYASRIHADAGDCTGTATLVATLATDHPGSSALALARSHAATRGCTLP